MSTEEKRALHNPNADIGTTALVNLAMAVGGGGGVEAS